MPSLAADLEFRGLIHQLSDPGLPARLDAGGLTAYIGFDPSQPSLQFGNLMQLCMLRRLQLAGHRPIVLLGGGTGMIGDPGGRSDERNLLGPAGAGGERGRHPAPARGLLGLQRRPPERSGRCSSTTATGWARSAWSTSCATSGKHFTVNQMIAKESVRSRLERAGEGISYTEFSYMLLQAYDFLRLHEDHGCTLQIGGSDQWGNIVMGVDLIGRAVGGEAFALTTPLATKPDGTKFGKSASGALWLDPKRTSPYLFYQFLVNTTDAVVDNYLCYFTFVDHDEIVALARGDGGPPRAPQRPAAPGPRGVLDGPRPGGDGAGGAGLGRPVRRGDRLARRGHAPGRRRGRTVEHDLAPRRSSRGWVWSTCSPRATWPSPRARRGA